MKQILATLAFAVGAACALPASAATIYAQDFETGPSADFTGGSIAETELYAGYGYGNALLHVDATPEASTTLTLNLAHGANDAHMNLSLAIIDSWDNGNFCCGPDRFSVIVDGKAPAFSAIFDNYLGQGPTVAPGLTSVAYGQALGFNAGFNDAAYGLSLDLGNLAAGTHTIQFVANGPGWQGGSDESFGIDNLAITATAVPEPASVALMLAGLLAVGSAARRKQGR